MGFLSGLIGVGWCIVRRGMGGEFFFYFYFGSGEEGKGGELSMYANGGNAGTRIRD